ncbi:MAG: hypothetical protein Q7J57_03015, partial [Gemmobacter sp.]|nr:hypothetical protein [Gemmobacter sp.]
IAGMTGMATCSLLGHAALAQAIGSARSVDSNALQRPTGKVLLTVRGLIGATNADDAAEFDMAMLDALPQQSFATSTIWTHGILQYSGPSLRSVLDAVQHKGTSVAATGANDYRATVPVALIEETAPIIANRLAGQPFDVRERGPLWLVFPYDAHERFRTEAVYAQSVWQLVALTIVAG